jgi:hypothetical protein
MMQRRRRDFGVFALATIILLNGNKSLVPHDGKNEKQEKGKKGGEKRKCYYELLQRTSAAVKEEGRGSRWKQLFILRRRDNSRWRCWVLEGI